ncbi:MAG: hypothetical protein K5647_03510 [Clostridiales bacterium]|nr:hypothetical protein [Clostridiales bacterium]
MNDMKNANSPDGGPLTAPECLGLLKRKADELKESGEDRFPKRSDFSEREVAAIKAFFGPWPRALEAAGIKDPPAFTSKDRNRERRIRAKRRRREESRLRERELPPLEPAGPSPVTQKEINTNTYQQGEEK